MTLFQLVFLLGFLTWLGVIVYGGIKEKGLLVVPALIVWLFVGLSITPVNNNPFTDYSDHCPQGERVWRVLPPMACKLFNIPTFKEAPHTYPNPYQAYDPESWWMD